MKNKKPKYWVVKNDESQLFKDTVIKKLNEISNLWGHGFFEYYGYNGQKRYRGTFASHDLDSLENSPTLLTLEEFIDLFVSPNEKYEKDEKDEKDTFSIMKNKAKAFLIASKALEEIGHVCDHTGASFEVIREAMSIVHEATGRDMLKGLKSSSGRPLRNMSHSDVVGHEFQGDYNELSDKDVIGVELRNGSRCFISKMDCNYYTAVKAGNNDYAGKFRYTTIADVINCLAKTVYKFSSGKDLAKWMANDNLIK